MKDFKEWLRVVLLYSIAYTTGVAVSTTTRGIDIKSLFCVAGTVLFLFFYFYRIKIEEI